MIAGLSRLLQLAGLAILPIALYIGLYEDNMQGEVRLLAIGGVVFLTGRLLQKKVDS